MKRARRTSLALVLGAILPLSTLTTGACSSDDDPVDPGQTKLRVIHLSPDAPSVDVWVNGSLRAVTDLSFAEGTDYLSVEAGSYTFDVSPAGSSASESVLNVTGAALDRDRSYTVVAFDSLGTIQALALEDDFDGLASGNIRVRAIHTAVGVGEVDIWLIPGEGSPSPLYEDVGFGVAGDYLDIPAEAFTIGFDLDNDAVPDVIFDIPALPAGTVANVFAVTDSESNVFLLAQLPDGSIAQIDPR